MYALDREARHSYLCGIIMLAGLILFVTAIFVERMVTTGQWIGGTLLILMFAVPTGYIYYDFFRADTLRQCFLRFTVDARGIHCYGYGCKPWSILWENIRVYRVDGYGYAKKALYKTKIKIFLLLSTDPQEKFSVKDRFKINPNRAFVYLRQESIDYILPYLPPDMHKRIQYAINAKEDYFGRR